jgi:YaiO family outer membrane protein
MTGPWTVRPRAFARAFGLAVWLLVGIALPAGAQAPSIEDATQLLRQGQLEAAAAAYARIVEAHPRDLDARKGLARALGRLHRLDEALAEYDRVLQVTARDPEAAIGRAAILARLDQLDDAEATLRQAAADHPDLVEAHLALGALLLRRGHPEEARTAFERARVLAPDEAVTLAGLGRAQAAAGDAPGARSLREQAVAAYDRRLATDPSDRDAAVGRAQILAVLGRRQEALAAYDRVLEASPQDVEALLGRVRLLQQEGRLDEAAVDAARAVAADSGSAEVYVALGDVRTRQSHFDEAAQAYAEAHALAPRAPEPVLGLARLHLWQDDLPGAKAGYEQALLLDPRNEDAIDALTRIARTPRPTRFRLDLGGRYEALGGRSDWLQGTTVLSMRPRRGTAVFVGLDQYRRNDQDDTQLSAGFGQALPQGFSVAGSVAYGPDAETVARHILEGEVARALGTFVTPSVRVRWSSYVGDTTATSLSPGIEIMLVPQITVLGRYFFTHASDAGDGHAGSIRVSIFPEERVSAYGAVAYGRETFVADTVEEVVRGLNVLTLAAGLRWRIREGLGLRLDYEYEDRHGSYVKHSVGAGVAIDF